MKVASVKDGYKYLKMFCELNVDPGNSVVMDVKRQLRALTHKDYDTWEYGKRYIIASDDKYPSYVEKIELPDDLDSLENAREWADTYISIPYIWRSYTPTGQWYTDDMHVFRINGKYWAYHGVSQDV